LTAPPDQGDLQMKMPGERDQQKWIPVLRPIALYLFEERMIFSPNRPYFGGSCAQTGHFLFLPA